jgi:hypothetical protein
MLTVNELSAEVEAKPELISLKYTTGTIITGTGTTTTVTDLDPGKYNFTVYSETGCSSAESEDILVALPPVIPSAPLIGPIDIPTCSCELGMITLTGLPATGNWTLTSNPTLGIVTGSGTETTITSVPAGAYVFRVTSEEGCVSVESDTAKLGLQPQGPVSGVSQDLENSLKLYPNPVENEMMVEFADDLRIINYEILDHSGRIVLNGKIQGSSVINTSSLASGVYLFRIGADGGYTLRKIVKK